MQILTPDELEARLRDIGATRYHNLHPFHRLLHGGRCTKGQVQAWALNRYCYQAHIPLKDASLIGRCDDPAVRREWRARLEDHDGTDSSAGSTTGSTHAGDTHGAGTHGGGTNGSAGGTHGGGSHGAGIHGGGTDGGIVRWLALTDALGLPREDVVAMRLILPATRFAVEAYVRFVRERTLLEAIASSLTELFSPKIIGERVAGMLANYSYITRDTLAYFDKRPPQAKRDSDFALAYVRQHARTPEQQQAVIDALVFKCSVLWSMLDALHFAYVEPGHPPPGAFRPAPAHAATVDV